MRFSLPLLASLLCALARAAEPPPDPNLPPAPMHEQVLHLPGDPFRPADLVVTVFMPEGPGPFPLAVFNHGHEVPGDPATMPRLRTARPAYYFLSRGYAVALPMMRGFSGSGGHLSGYGCALDQFALSNGRDIQAVINDLAENKRIDTSRVIVAGANTGGWNTLGLGALQPPGVRGLVNFGGVVHTSDCGDSDGQAMAQSAGKLGAATKIPGIWFYGKGDGALGPDIWRPMHDAYVGQGANVDLVDVSRFMSDSQQMFTRLEMTQNWTQRLDAFLARIGMPSREKYPQYLPPPWPKPTHFADSANAAAIPWIDQKDRQLYREFLKLPFPRAFLISAGGQAAVAHGGFDPLARGLGMCRAAHLICLPYTLDNDVVFVPPHIDTHGAPPAGTHFAAIGDVAALPWVNDKGRAAYTSFLQHAPPRAFVIGTGGESAATFGGADPLARALALCAKNHIECRPYAVDNQVVWKKPPPPEALPATHYAAIENLAAVPWVNAGSLELYKKFLAQKLPRAFAVAPGGQAASTQGGYDPASRAIEKCHQAGLACRLYAVDNDVVWTPGK